MIWVNRSLLRKTPDKKLSLRSGSIWLSLGRRTPSPRCRGYAIPPLWLRRFCVSGAARFAVNSRCMPNFRIRAMVNAVRTHVRTGMTSRERVQAALAKNAVDQLPIFMWFHPQTARKLAAGLDVPLGCVAETMGNDLRQWRVARGLVGHPLAGAPREDVLAYRFPIDHFEELLGLMLPVVRECGDSWPGCDVSPCILRDSLARARHGRRDSRYRRRPRTRR
jgi:hypothetical protein